MSAKSIYREVPFLEQLEKRLLLAQDWLTMNKTIPQTVDGVKSSNSYTPVAYWTNPKGVVYDDLLSPAPASPARMPSPPEMQLLKTQFPPPKGDDPGWTFTISLKTLAANSLIVTGYDAK